ncbi:hypothetical protein XU18_3264 [Perkinsela sp. CCAP 1560/4]|nr:hypothetical protein XU18_3264 [Perkinsela sp. CCAP 1560/4]|eukprot:KNH05742.1 hypothetical protein XU18_3264 [Perkinsela sp. CCAP 1560/4]
MLRKLFPNVNALQHARTMDHGKSLLQNIDNSLKGVDSTLAHRALKYTAAPLRAAGYKIPKRPKKGQ